VNAAILKGLAVFSVLGCVAGLVAVAMVDWSMIRFYNELVATNRIAVADILSSEARMMMLLNLAIVVAVALNLVAAWLMVRSRRSYGP
jgi:hypothetical protein